MKRVYRVTVEVVAYVYCEPDELGTQAMRAARQEIESMGPWEFKSEPVKLGDPIDLPWRAGSLVYGPHGAQENITLGDALAVGGAP